MQIMAVEMPETARFRTNMFFEVLCIFLPEKMKIIFSPLKFPRSLNKHHNLVDDVRPSERGSRYESMTNTTFKNKLLTLLLVQTNKV